MHSSLAIGAALGSGCCFAVSSVLQHRGAACAPRSSGVRLLGHLVVRPIWWAGLLAAGGTLVLQAVALSAGELVFVQPLMLVGLLFALPVSVLLEKRRPSVQEWGWAALLVIGLTVFLRAANPAAGPPLPDNWRMVQLGAAAVGLSALAAAGGFGPGRRHRAALLGLATGIAYGLSAALMKYSFGLASDHIGRLLASWPGYALLAVGTAGILLNQAAYHAGPLAGALPPLAIADPVVAIVFGVAAFSEGLATTAGALTLQVLGFGAVAIAIVQLARQSAGRDPRDPTADGGAARPAPAKPASRS